MVRDLSDLKAHNPHSLTNDSLQETNILADTYDENDPPNAAFNTTTQLTSNQTNNRQYQSWDPPEGSNIRLVEVEEDLCGLTNAKLVFMDWEASYSSYQRAIGEEFSSFDFGVIFAESLEVTTVETLLEESKFSNFEIGESSGTTHDNKDLQVIGGTLTRMIPREAQYENKSMNHNLTCQHVDNTVGNLEFSTHTWEISPQLAVSILLSLCYKTQSPTSLLNHLQGLTQSFMQLNGLSMRQLNDPRIHYDAALSNHHASTEVMFYDPSLSFNKLQYQ